MRRHGAWSDYSLLFGEVLGISPNAVAPTAALTVACAVAVMVLYRPLVLTSVLAESGRAGGVNPFVIELCFLAVVALAATMTVPVVGTALIFSLLIGPAAAARSFTARPGAAIAISVVIAMLTVWAAIALSFETNWPVGFFVGVGSAVAYAIGRAWGFIHLRGARSPAR
jgi:zinc/manganese transport system permease protein